MEAVVQMPVWALMVAPAVTAIVGVIAGYWLRLSSVGDLQEVVECVIGDTHYHVAGDYIERPFEDIPPTH